MQLKQKVVFLNTHNYFVSLFLFFFISFSLTLLTKPQTNKQVEKLHNKESNARAQNLIMFNYNIKA